MFTPNPRMNAAAAHTRPKRRRPSAGAVTLTLAGSLAIALTATVSASAVASPSQGILAAATRSSTPNPPPVPFKHSIRDEADRKCSPRNFFRFHDFEPRNFFVPRTHFIDGPGGTMTATVRRQHRVYFEVEIEREKGSEIDRDRARSRSRTTTTTTAPNAAGTTTAEANTTDAVDTKNLIRRLRNNVNPLLAEELIVEAGHDYTQEISDGMYGNMWYRVFGYRVGFAQWRQLTDCSTHRVVTGIASVPARVEGWRYWETRHPMYKGRKLSEK
ncbi:hypothetical protein ACIBLB_07475 [Streptosporangium canum]|uniref:hypothetical protein n=1 Tax=Streptosporangium canum TaxID=324952 RepID=UPI0037B8CDB4